MMCCREKPRFLHGISFTACVRVFVCVCVCVCVFVCVFVCVLPRIRDFCTVFLHEYIGKHIYVNTYICKDIYVNVYITGLYPYIHIYECVAVCCSVLQCVACLCVCCRGSEIFARYSCIHTYVNIYM